MIVVLKIDCIQIFYILHYPLLWITYEYFEKNIHTHTYVYIYIYIYIYIYDILGAIYNINCIYFTPISHQKIMFGIHLFIYFNFVVI